MMCGLCQGDRVSTGDPALDVIMVSMTGTDDKLVAWLLEGDPSIRWRVHRDLLGSPASTVDAERARVATEGWGAKLISLQDPDGRWGDGDYSPKWTSTTYTLLHLVWLGLPPRHPAALAGCERLWEWQCRWRGPGDLHRLYPGTAHRCSRIPRRTPRRRCRLPARPTAQRRWLELRCPRQSRQAQLVPHQHPGARGPRRLSASRWRSGHC